MRDSQQRVVIAVGASSIAGGATQFTRRSSRFTLSELEEVNDVGEYWCQLRLINNGTLFQERSNILNLGTEAQYQGLRLCMGSSVVDKIDCLNVLRIVNPDDNAPTDSGSVVEPTSFSELSPTPITGGTIEESKNNSRNLAALYVAIAAVMFFSILILLLIITIVLLRYKQKTNNIQDEGIN